MMLTVTLSLLVGMLSCCRTYACPDQCSCSVDQTGLITSVNCSDKNLTAVPKHIPKSVKTLNLRYNYIPHLDNDSFQDLSFLCDLDLSFNRLHNIAVGAFLFLESLQSLDLSYNSLPMDKQAYPKGTFKGLKNLQKLNIRGNLGNTNISLSTGYPDWALHHLTNLEELYIDGVYNVSLGEGFRNLTQLRILDFSGFAGYCYINNIEVNMFSNIRTSNPLKLNMSQCGIVYIHPMAFKALPTLEVFDLCDNGHLRFPQFEVASVSFQFTNLKVLNLTTINRGHRMILRGEYFQNMKRTKLTSLIINHNVITCIEMRAIANLPQTLQYLSMRKNKLVDPFFLLQVVLMQNLKVLDIGFQLQYTQTAKSNVTVSFPKSNVCSRDKFDPVKAVDERYKTKDKRFERLSKPKSTQYVNILNAYIGQNGDLILSNRTEASISNPSNFDSGSVQNRGIDKTCDLGSVQFHLDTIPLPPKLHALILDHIDFSLYTLPLLNFTTNNSLRFIDLSHDVIPCFEGPFQNLKDLKVLDLSFNRCDNVSPFFFKDMQNLTHLRLQGNDLGYSLLSDTDGDTFSAQFKLKYLSLERNRIRKLPELMFRNLVNLEHLDLSDNSLFRFGARIGHMKQLTFLNLSTNQFSSLDEALRHDLDDIARHSNLTIEISGNDFQCNCDSLNFVQWIILTNVTIYNFSNSVCRSGNGSYVRFPQLETMWNGLWFDCHAKNMFIIVLVLFVLSVSVQCLVSAAYYKRWKLRYLYYIGRRRVNPYSFIRAANPIQTPLDVFISYDDEETRLREFLQNTLLQKLESHGISCLVSETFFLSGRRNNDIVYEAILGTRKTLALLTNDFFRSYERLLEFNMAVLHGMETRQDIVLPVAMDQLDTEQLPQEVRAFLKAYPPIEYQDSDAFWADLIHNIRTDAP